MSIKQPVSIELNLKSNSKLTLLETLCQLFWEAGKLYNRDLFLEEVFKREALLSTYCGEGVAIPHAASSSSKRARIYFCSMYRNKLGRGGVASAIYYSY